jgi:hypothetical protein
MCDENVLLGGIHITHHPSLITHFPNPQYPNPPIDNPMRFPLLAAVFLGMLVLPGATHGQEASPRWSVAVDAGPRYAAQQDDATSLLTYEGIGPSVSARLRRRGTWQGQVDASFHRTRRTPIGGNAEVRADQSTTAALSVSVRRRAAQFAGARVHAGLRLGGWGSFWEVGRAAGGAEETYDWFASLAVDAAATRRVGAQGRARLHVALPLTATVSRPGYAGSAQVQSLATWPTFRRVDAGVQYAHALTSRLSARAGYEVNWLHYDEAPTVTRLAHRFRLGLSFHFGF